MIRENTVKKKKNQGISLLELMIAMAVIAIALLQLVNVIIHTINTKQSTEELAKAKEAASSMIEQIRATTYDSIVTNFQNTTFSVEGLTLGTGGAGTSPTGSVTIDDSNANLLDVRVAVTWTSKSTNRTYETRALITR